MIRFTCKNCGQKIKVSDQYAGKKGKCPKCKGPIVIPAAEQQPQEQASILKFRCPHCSQKIGLPVEYAGKQVKCAKCKQPLLVPPQPPAKPAAAAQQGPAEPPNVWDQLGGTEELRLSESTAPVVEGSLSFEAPPQKPVPQEQQFGTYEDPLRGFAVQQEPVREKGSIVNPGLYIGLGCVAAVAVAVVLWVVFILGMFQSVMAKEVHSPEAKEITEQFIYMMEGNKFEEVKALLAEDLKTGLEDTELEGLAERMTAGEVLELEYVQATSVNSPDMEQFLLWYSLKNANGYVNVIVSLLNSNGGMVIDGAGVMDASGNRTTIGSKSYEELVEGATAPLVGGTSRSVKWSLPCIIMVIVGMVGIVQLVSVWIIFEKAGQPGWAILIPIYNMWVWALVADKPGWMGLLTILAGFIPFVGGLVQLGLWIVITIGVAKAFGRGLGFGLGLCFLPIVFYPILAFGND